jgi:hypothetical protein
MATTTIMKSRVLLLLGSLCLFAPLAQAFLAPSLYMAAAVTRRPAAMAAGSSLRMQQAAATTGTRGEEIKKPGGVGGTKEVT